MAGSPFDRSVKTYYRAGRPFLQRILKWPYSHFSQEYSARRIDVKNIKIVYFDFMDFACSQAWGRQIVTPAPDRQRVSAMLLQGWNQMDAQCQAQIMALPQAWIDLQQSWKSMGERERSKKRAEWRDQISVTDNSITKSFRRIER